MTAPHVRGACPTLSSPMETGDGLLVRIVPLGPIPLEAFFALCAASREHGNGTMEVTARGNLQIRGLTPDSAPLFASKVADLGIALADEANVLNDPLPNTPLSIVDSHALAAVLRKAIARAGLQLAPKVSVIVDDGSRLHLDALTADVRLRALQMPGGVRLHLALAGDAASATPLALIAPDDAVEAVICVLRTIADAGPDARAADILRRGGIAEFRSALGNRNCAALRLPERPKAEAIATHRLRDGSLALGVGLAFGHVQATMLLSALAAAHENGATWVQPVPDRALLLGAFAAGAAAAVAHEAAWHGLIVDAGDPRRRIVACAGAPLCASGLIEARALAAKIARNVPLPGKGVVIHVSGCAKGCAHQGVSPLTIVGREHGCDLVTNGSARATPVKTVATGELLAGIMELTGALKEPVNA